MLALRPVLLKIQNRIDSEVIANVFYYYFIIIIINNDNNN